MIKKTIETKRLTLATALLLLCLPSALYGQQQDSLKNSRLESVKVQTKKSSGLSRISGPENGIVIGQDELFRAACCNLGESFVTNPSVDVNYNDAAVGAKQIKLLGLSNEYVQMLIEGLPMQGHAALPYQLGYVPGSWMKNISVSKGTSSVKYGFQSVTGQIDVEYLKPDDPEGVLLNLYGDSRLRTEGNIVANKQLNHHLSTEILAHVDKDFGHHDDNNDGWHDSPAIAQYNLQNRWKYMKGRYIFHGGLATMSEEREGGQLPSYTANPYRVLLDSRKHEAYMKHAFLLNKKHNTNIALMANYSNYHLGGTFGAKEYGYDENALNAQLVLEHEFNAVHSLSTGLSAILEKSDEQIGYNNSTLSAVAGYAPNMPYTVDNQIGGAFAQYTFKPSYKLTVMAGLRADHHQQFGWFWTPRLHAKLVATDWLTLRASSGKGWRVPQPLAEHHWLLASGRQLTINQNMNMEEAWNNGISASFYIPIHDKSLKINTEYYYTFFLNQTVVDYDSDPLALTIDDLNGDSYSHTVQIDATYPFGHDLEVTAAFRLNDVRCTYGGTLMEKPLTSRYKGLVTATWKPRMGLWSIDLTLQLNGGGRMPTPYTLADGSASWDDEFPAFPQLNLQVTREFRHFSVYIGGENLTNYKQPVPVIDATQPWSNTFEPTMVWGPVHGIMAYAGVRMNLFGKE
ncbi:MAG: TonB-dependent receptor [Bacteroidales bacterium]|nr:TonB-dependent receptor [Bacteroidales bacterium]